LEYLHPAARNFRTIAAEASVVTISLKIGLNFAVTEPIPAPISNNFPNF